MLNSQDRPYLTVALLLATLTSGLFVTFLITAGFPEGTICPDGSGYVSVSEYLKGENVELQKFRASRPVVPILALPLSYLVDTRVSFIINNAILFVVMAGAFYVLAKDLLGTSLHAFYAVLLLIFAYPVYYRGINVTVDLASWLIFVGMACLILRLKRKGPLTIEASRRMALVCAVGTLVTELVLASYLLVCFQYLFENLRKLSIRALVLDLLVIGAYFAIPVVILQIAIYLVFDYSIFHKAQKMTDFIAIEPFNLGPVGTARALVGAFSVSLLLVPLGILGFRKNKRHVDLHLAMLLSSLITLLVVYMNSIRFVFVLFPLVFTFAIRGVVFLVGAVVSASDRLAGVAQAVLVAGVCLFNVILYVAFLQYGSTIAMAKRFLPFLLN